MAVQIIRHDWSTLRERPGLFLDPVSITALRNFIFGYQLGRTPISPGIEFPFEVPGDFHDWVAYRLHASDSSMGWARLINERRGDGEQAVEYFFTLLDEYHVRVPRTVAIASECFQANTVQYAGQVYTNMYPTDLRLIAYNTEDPGLFLVADNPPVVGWRDQYCVNFDRFKSDGPGKYHLEILDQEAFERWSSFGAR